MKTTSTFKRRVRLAVLFFLAAPAVLQGAPEHAAAYQPGEVIVQFRENVPVSIARSFSRLHGRYILREIRAQEPVVHHVRLPANASVAEALQSLGRNPLVQFVQPNYIYQFANAPGDPHYGQSWGLHNQNAQGNDIGAEAAWDVQTDCSSVVVAIIDSGVNLDHEDLRRNLVYGSYACPDGVRSQGCSFGASAGEPFDYINHGSAVAGIVGARANNGFGSAGVCWTAKLLPLKVGGPEPITSAAVAAAIYFAANPAQGAAKILNMSLAFSNQDPAIQAALAYAESEDVLAVVAAGNAAADHSITPTYPCDVPLNNVVCVAAVDQNFQLASFSDFDSSPAPASRRVDIAAPGVQSYAPLAATFSFAQEAFDPFNLQSWSKSPGSGWGGAACPLTGTNYLRIPSLNTWCPGAIAPAPATLLSDRIMKTFDLSGADRTYVFLSAHVTLQDPGDVFEARFTAGATDPFAADSFTAYFAAGPQNLALTQYFIDITPCGTACTLAFRLTTDAVANAPGDGVVIDSLLLNRLTLHNNYYGSYNGTSFAAPHVSGIAALVRARNPDFLVEDVANAILTGGTAAPQLQTITRSGRVASASGSLKYIPATGAPTLTVGTPPAELE